jgi:hypothetical protein
VTHLTDIPHEIDLTPKSKWTHEWYTPVGAYDLGKVKETCEEAKRGDVYNKPSSSRIHFHRYDEPCEGHDHEEYVPE